MSTGVGAARQVTPLANEPWAQRHSRDHAYLDLLIEAELLPAL